MNRRADFLARVRATPLCETSRLAYADWLDENAESDRDRAQAELIRVACEPCRRKSYRSAAVNRWLYHRAGRYTVFDLFPALLALDRSDEARKLRERSPILAALASNPAPPYFAQQAKRLRAVISWMYPSVYSGAAPVPVCQEVQFGIRLGIVERFKLLTAVPSTVSALHAAVRADHPLAVRVERARLLDPNLGTVLPLQHDDE